MAPRQCRASRQGFLPLTSYPPPSNDPRHRHLARTKPRHLRLNAHQLAPPRLPSRHRRLTKATGTTTTRRRRGIARHRVSRDCDRAGGNCLHRLDGSRPDAVEHTSPNQVRPPASPNQVRPCPKRARKAQPRCNKGGAVAAGTLHEHPHLHLQRSQPQGRPARPTQMGPVGPRSGPGAEASPRR